MKFLLIAIRSCPRFLNWLLFCSLVVLVVKIIWLDRIPEIFPNAKELGSLMNDLLLANVAGYIFYILSAEMPRVIDRRNNGAEIIRLAERAAYNITGFLQMLYNHNMAHHPGSERILTIYSVDRKIVDNEFGLVSPIEMAPMTDGIDNGTTGQQLNWLAAMAKHEFYCRKYISELWKLSPFIESELSSLLLQIENSSYSASMDSLRKLELPLLAQGVTLTNTDLKSWSPNYYEGYELARYLIDYCGKFRRIYSIK